ncbi:amino acid adenylation domain-containing protein [Streptomyces sp. NBC_00249]|uniref:amino acid adenylation domain-containing protein n=1 Tax=Streptomyces sp. NBC_00249 TaxID=2975690 RepID=UPI0022594BDA|nr:amino acid adenylation domain-containing protein [Streptomyces sp. NBC_00249]MCX5194626.1 amino acid adenylation domain-containing protein [Streptomyces sp. NBC_00249]
MTTTTTMTNDDTGRLCQALALRVHTGADPARLGRALERVLPGARLWTEDVQGGADSDDAAARRDRELSRPADPRTGPGVRSVLLRYADGRADLVLVAHRATLADPHDLAQALLVEAPAPAPVPAGEGDRLREALAALDRLPAPAWGLGEAAATTTGRLRFPVPAEGGLPAALTLRAALGLVLARCTGRAEVVLGVDAAHALAFTADPATGVGAYLEQVGRAVPAPVAGSAHEPLVGLVTTGHPDALTGEGAKAETLTLRPFLAPVHPLSVHVVAEGPTALDATCHYRHSAFGDAAVEWFAAMLATAHRALTGADPATPLGELPLFDEEQRRRLADLGGLGRSPEVPEERIEQAVRQWAERTPDAPALTFEDEVLTYAALDASADALADGLRRHGVRPGDRVGVCLERSASLVVVLLAVLKAGAAYVPMDPAYPAERLAHTTEDAALSLVVTESERFPQREGVRLVRPDALAAADRQDGGGPAGEALSPDAHAYVIYTSGSTGKPKGVGVPHRNVAALLAATREDFGLVPGDVWTLFHSSAFDFSVWEIWGCLTTGGRLVVVPYWASREPERFAALLGTERVTVLSQTPSAFAQLMEADRETRVSDSVRLVVFGGEPLDTRPLRHWQDRHPEWQCRLVNMFGITETTVHVTAQTVTRREALTGSRSVGRPLPGWHLYVLDPEGRELPPGVPGEIYVGGLGVAGAYLGRPELTAQRFLPDPYAPTPLYRSGDRGRLLPDGRLEHLGRLDNQVKLRGFRIELDEIRARLLDAPGVSAAAVVLRPGEPGDTAGARLDGYVVFRSDGQADGGDTEEVRRHAARFLPDHMVPATVTALPALPLTPNGKVDGARLPLPRTGPADAEDSDEPVGDDTESRLRALWEKVFGFRVGLDDDFFGLGGNSLLGIRLLAAMKAAGLPPFPLPQLYLHRTVRALAAVLDGAEART